MSCYQEVVDDVAGEEEAVDGAAELVAERLRGDGGLGRVGTGERPVYRPDPNGKAHLTKYDYRLDSILINIKKNIIFFFLLKQFYISKIVALVLSALSKVNFIKDKRVVGCRR